MIVVTPMKWVDLNDKNFLLFAMKAYTNPHVHDMKEFDEDLNIPIHLKKLFTRYAENGDLKERLIINHIISFFNIFEKSAAQKILFYKLHVSQYRYLKTFLVFLNRCPNAVQINGQFLDIEAIPVDDELMEKIRANIKIYGAN